jgi:hypothetical protein
MKAPHIKTIGPLPLRLGFTFIIFAFAWFALSPSARAVDPPPDGGYPGKNTAEGEEALFSLTNGKGTRPLVVMRSLATQTATPTRPSALQHSRPI